MRIADAPPAGWYPDPEGSSRLRWWEGTDWTDRYRSKPVDQNFLVDDELRGKLERQKQREEEIAAAGGDPYRAAVEEAAGQAANQAASWGAEQYGQMPQQYGQQAQQYAQQQWQNQQQRATDWARQQSRQAHNVAQQMSPLVSQQAANVGRYAKRIFWLVVVLFILFWFLRLLATGVFTDIIEQIEENQTGAGVSAGLAVWGRYRSGL